MTVKFSDLGLSEKTLKAVTERGYEIPTPIQAEGIPPVLQSRDVLGLAQTGTGKTASFTLPMIDLLARGRAKARMPRSVILCPTRELAAQVSENFEAYGKYQKLSMALLIGGVSFAEQDRKLDRGVDVLIATPGRLLDHFERGKLMMNGVQILVIDEADRMLDMGFIPDIEKISKLTPFTRQTLLFSATMPKEIERLADAFLHNPARIEVAPPASPAETVSQHLCNVAPMQKRAALRALIRKEEIQNGIIFCNRKRDVSVLLRSLTKHGFAAGALHGDMDQHSRLATLDQFKNNEITLLVASDVAARGLDIPAVSHVFNFDVPFNSEDYVHRIGRTGRAGRTGSAFMLATRNDQKLVVAIEEMTGKKIPTLELEGLEAPAEPESSEEESRGNRRGRGGRGGRSARGSERGERSDRSDRSDRNDRADRSDRPDRDRESAEAKSREGRGRRGGRGRRRGEDEDDTPVIGMGSHVPAFMLRSVRPAREAAKPAAPSKKSPTATDSAASDAEAPAA